MSNSTDDCPESPFVTSERCSGHGQCVNFTCVCDEYWSGKSDLLNADGFDCHIHKPTVQLLWGLSLLVVFGVWIACIPKIITRVQQYKAIKRRRAAQGRHYSVCQSPSMLSIIVYFVFCGCPFIFFAGLKVLDEDDVHRVGVTWEASIAFFLTVSGFYGAFLLFQPFLTKNLFVGDPRYAYMNKLQFLLAICGSSTSAFASALPMFLVNEEAALNDRSFRLYVSYFAISGICLVGYMGQAYLVLARSKYVLQFSYQLRQEEWILEMKKNLSVLQKELMIQALLQGLVYLAFACIPFLYTKHDYFLPISWTGAAFLWYRIFSAVVTHGNGARQDYAETTTFMSFEYNFNNDANETPNGNRISAMYKLDTEANKAWSKNTTFGGTIPPSVTTQVG